MEEQVKIVVFAPLSYSRKVREAVGQAGAGKIGTIRFVVSLVQELVDSNQKMVLTQQ